MARRQPGIYLHGKARPRLFPDDMYPEDGEDETDSYTEVEEARLACARVARAVERGARVCPSVDVAPERPHRRLYAGHTCGYMRTVRVLPPDAVMLAALTLLARAAVV